jgi:hypothetical protein
MKKSQSRELLDWAETIICNSVPMSHCSQAEWDKIRKNWRDAKHAAFPDGRWRWFRDKVNSARRLFGLQ